jgi:diguanylate cyclase (GGDEF)-like protein
VRDGYPVAVLMFDLDHFKRFNDTFGHSAGDALLRELGGFLNRQVRGGDIACRYGGEEFVLILTDTSLDDARSRAEQLREQVNRVNVQYRGQTLSTVTLSLGLAVSGEQSSTAEELLRQADAALYRAKAEGRDRVIVAEGGR